MVTSESVIEFFGRHLPVPGESLEQKLSFEYLSVLDSMGVVQMVTDLEATFAVEFSPEDMQSSEFRTVGGVLRLLERLSARAD